MEPSGETLGKRKTKLSPEGAAGNHGANAALNLGPRRVRDEGPGPLAQGADSSPVVRLPRWDCAKSGRGTVFSYAPAGLVRLSLFLPRVSLRFTLGYDPAPLRGFKINDAASPANRSTSPGTRGRAQNQDPRTGVGDNGPS